MHDSYYAFMTDKGSKIMQWFHHFRGFRDVDHDPDLIVIIIIIMPVSRNIPSAWIHASIN